MGEIRVCDAGRDNGNVINLATQEDMARILGVDGEWRGAVLVIGDFDGGFREGLGDELGVFGADVHGGGVACYTAAI